LTLLLLGACAAPERLTHYRSPLLEAPSGPFSPEGRPDVIPGEEGPGTGPGTGGRVAVSGEAIAETAASWVGRSSVSVGNQRYPDDCTGLVRAAYAKQGVDLFSEGSQPGENGVSAIYRFASRRGRIHQGTPAPGDIVFFRETYDRNRDGRENDGLTHVGIVERVEKDGTVEVIHRVARGVVRYRMNVAHAHDRTGPNGSVINDYLREGSKNRLAGELFAGYGSLSR
jgi:surface antigen